MAKVKAKVACFIDNHLRQEGDVFEYSGVRNTNLEYIDAADEAGTEEQPARKLRRPRQTDATE